MAIRNFKDIIENKGYRISSKDRKIFEKESLQSFFGFSDSDMIEFIIYDINDNQLVQQNGELVRYIPLNSENIREYFLIADGTLLQSYKLPTEYFIDVERLIREAGYNEGLFKTQITLINKRVGSQSNSDKLWIQEISPSRTEAKLLPLRARGKKNIELEERFIILTNGKQFRDDTIFEAIQFAESIKANLVVEEIIKKYTESFSLTLASEYKINDLEIFSTKVHNKFIEASFFEFTNRISDIKNVNYGKPKDISPAIELSYDYIVDRCITLLTQIVSYFLPQIDVKNNSQYEYFINPSEDDIEELIRRRESDTSIEAQNVEQIPFEFIPSQEEADFLISQIVEEFDLNPGTPIFISDPPKVGTPENPPSSGGGGGSTEGGADGDVNGNVNNRVSNRRVNLNAR